MVEAEGVSRLAPRAVSMRAARARPKVGASAVAALPIDESDEPEFESGVAPEATGDGAQYGGGQGKGDAEGGDELSGVGGGNVEFLGDCREEAGDHECVSADGEGHDGEREEDPQRHIV